MHRLEYQDYIERNQEKILDKYKRMLIAELQDETIEGLSERLDDLRFIAALNKKLYSISSIFTKENIEETNQDEIPS